jgi:hypothetical protein
MIISDLPTTRDGHSRLIAAILATYVEFRWPLTLIITQGA